jgi:2-polyprenyl-3-methyl-5-hydroxy-6-metoxy-1,4-benzoquinol methylase
MNVATTFSEHAAYGDMLQACVSCGSERIRYWRQKNYHYTRQQSQQAFHIYRCDCCGSGFLNQPPHPHWLQAIYRYSGQALTQPVGLQAVLDRETAFPNCTVDAARISKLADQLNASGNRHALDIGSGFGFYTQALRKQGYQTVSINPGQYENQVFTAMNGDEPLPIMFEQYQTEQRFGVVVMSQVLEHLLQPDAAVKKITDLLSKGGVFACAVPNYNSFLVKLLGTRDNACLWVPEHVNYFTENGLQALLTNCGLQVVKVEQITRVPSHALSKRLGLRGRPAQAVDALLKPLQQPFVRLINALGLGVYLNIYAVKV